jgi:hypothetical protein
VRSLTLGLEGTNPRFPWKPSTTMLTYRLTGAIEHSGSTATNTTSLSGPGHRDHSGTRRPHIFAHHGAPEAPRCRRWAFPLRGEAQRRFWCHLFTALPQRGAHLFRGLPGQRGQHVGVGSRRA